MAVITQKILPSVFKKVDGDPSTVAALVGECETNILRCGPPTIEIFGGSGVGGFCKCSC